MPASLAVRAHWSVSQPVALKNATSLMPGVHSLPENVLNDQQMNMPHLSPFSSAARFCMSTGSAARAESARQASSVMVVIRVRFISCPPVGFHERRNSYSRNGCSNQYNGVPGIQRDRPVGKERGPAVSCGSRAATLRPVKSSGCPYCPGWCYRVHYITKASETLVLEAKVAVGRRV